MRLDVATISVTCISDGRAHHVPDTELAMGTSHRNGYCLAVCGHLVAAAPMVEPDGEPCQLCTEMWDLNRRRQRRERV